MVLPEPVNVIMEPLSDAMRGFGYSLPPAVVTLVCICSIRVLWVATLFAADPTYNMLMAVYPASWVVTTLMLWWLYRRHQKTLETKTAGSFD